MNYLALYHNELVNDATQPGLPSTSCERILLVWIIWLLTSRGECWKAIRTVRMRANMMMIGGIHSMCSVDRVGGCGCVGRVLVRASALCLCCRSSEFRCGSQLFLLLESLSMTMFMLSTCSSTSSSDLGRTLTSLSIPACPHPPSLHSHPQTPVGTLTKQNYPSIRVQSL